MKLIEEFKYALWEDTDATGDEVENKCEKIANKFAVDFFNWAKSYQSNDRNNWGLSTKELLEIYKGL